MMPLAMWTLSAQVESSLVAAGWFLGFIVLAILVRLFGALVARRWLYRLMPDFTQALVIPVRGLVVWALLLMGTYYALSGLQPIREDERLVELLAKVFAIAWVVLAVGSAVRLTNAIAEWSSQRAQEKEPGRAREFDQRSGFFRKLVIVVVVFLGVLYVLHIAGVDTNPLLAGGAIGGLVIGLVLQDTLSNLFAGFLMNVDRPVRIGDLVKLESGEEGFIEEIGWRYTKVRLWSNVLVVVPNSQLSKSIITNYHLPAGETSVYVTCGVAYDTDLDRAEEVIVQAGRQVQARVPGAVPNWTPLVRWREFGESSIVFLTVLRAADPTAQYLLRSEFIKELHRQLKEAGIEIPFPMRTVIMKKPSSVFASEGDEPS